MRTAIFIGFIYLGDAVNTKVGRSEDTITFLTIMLIAFIVMDLVELTKKAR